MEGHMGQGPIACMTRSENLTLEYFFGKLLRVASVSLPRVVEHLFRHYDQFPTALASF